MLKEVENYKPLSSLASVGFFSSHRIPTLINKIIIACEQQEIRPLHVPLHSEEKGSFQTQSDIKKGADASQSNGNGPNQEEEPTVSFHVNNARR